MTVVSDSSPLITLSKIGQFDLLPQLYRTIIITPEVYAEVAVTGSGLVGASQIAFAWWIVVQPIKRIDELSRARQRFNLGAGELSVIVLAQELKADAVLIDASVCLKRRFD